MSLVRVVSFLILIISYCSDPSSDHIGEVSLFAVQDDIAKMKLSLYLWLGAISTLTSALAIDQTHVNALIPRQETASSATSSPTPSSTATSNDPNQTDQPASGIYGSDSNSQGVDTDGGASGHSSGSSFNLSTGGLVAIIIIVVAVVLFGGKFKSPTHPLPCLTPQTMYSLRP